MNKGVFQACIKEMAKHHCETLADERNLVIFGDGSTVHMAMSADAFNPTAMNWRKATKDRPVTLKTEV